MGGKVLIFFCENRKIGILEAQSIIGLVDTYFYDFDSSNDFFSRKSSSPASKSLKCARRLDNSLITWSHTHNVLLHCGFLSWRNTQKPPRKCTQM